MKKPGRLFSMVVSGLALVVFVTFYGCAGSSAKVKKEGFLGDYYQNLRPGPEGGVKMRWLKPGTDFTQYNKVMLDSVIFFLAEDAEQKGMDPQEMKDLSDGFNLALVNTLKAKCPIVSEPGPDVVRIRFAVTDIHPSNPAVSGISSVIPVGIGISLVKKGATGSWAGSGATRAEMMAIDSATGEVIAVAQDERTAGFSDRFSKWGSANEAFKFWAERIVLFMDAARRAK